jgi:hypothetical protein
MVGALEAVSWELEARDRKFNRTDEEFWRYLIEVKDLGRADTVQWREQLWLLNSDFWLPRRTT